MKRAAFSSFNIWESKDLSIWRAHSCLIFERKVHSISLSECHTETVRLHSAKGFVGLILNKSLKPYCPSVTNPERKARPSIQLPNQCTEQNFTAFAGGKTALWAFACRKTYKSPFIYHKEKPEKYITCKACRRPRGRAWADFTECKKAGILPAWGDRKYWWRKKDCQMLGKFFSWQGWRKTIYLAVIRYCYRPVILDG